MPERQVTILAKLTDKMTGPLRGLVGMFGRLGRAAVKAGTIARAAMRGVSRAIAFLRRSIFSLRNLLLAGAFAGVLKVFADFERGIANVATLVDTTVVSMEDLSEAVLDVSRNTGESLGSLNEALFDIISAGVEAEKAGQVLLEASKLAKGGATSTAAATKGIVSVMNAYGLAVEDASALSDAFFTAQKGGITTVDALSRSIGKLAPTASLAGFSIDEMLASVAAVTKAGVSTTAAITGMKSVITTLIKPTEGAREAARKLEIQFDVSRLKAGRFTEFLEELREKTELDERVLAKLFPNVKAFATIANLAAKDGESFNQILGTMADKAGATAEAVAKVEKTLADKVKSALANLKIFFVRVGEAAKPFVEDVLKKINDFFKDMGQRRATIQAFIKNVAAAIGKIGSIIASIFRQGDVMRFVINIITGAITAATRLLIAAIPTFIQIAKSLGRQFGIAVIDGIFGATKESIARRLATGDATALKFAAKFLGIGEEELNDLRAQGQKLIDLEKGIALQRAELREREEERAAKAEGRMPSALRTFGPKRMVGISDEEIEQRIKRTTRRLDETRKALEGSTFQAVSDVDKAMLDDLSSKLVKDGTQIFKDFFAGLPAGMSPETKKAMDELSAILGPEWTAAMEAARAKDEAARIEAAKREGERIGEAVSEGVGTGFITGGVGADDLTGMMQTLDVGIMSSQQSMQMLGAEIQKVRALGEGGFITQAEAQERENELIASGRAEVELLAVQFAALQETIGKSKPLTKLYGEELEAMSSKLAIFTQQLDDYTETQGTFFTGLEAGLVNTIEKLGDLRQAGLSVGQTLASSIGDGLIVALEKGGAAFKQFALNTIKQLAQMILKAMIYKAIMAGLGGFNAGGLVGGNRLRFALGGSVPGPNVNRDVVDAKLTPGEYVQPRGVVDHYGVQIMEALRRRLIPRSALLQYGGTVRPVPTGRLLQGGGQASPVASQPSPAYVVADDDTMDRLLNGGESAFFEFLRRRADTINGVLRSDG